MKEHLADLFQLVFIICATGLVLIFSRKKMKRRKLQAIKDCSEWIETTMPDGSIEIQIPNEQYERWAKERHKKDRCDRLIKKDGFHDKGGGQDGHIYFVENGQLCEIYYERSGDRQYHILLHFDTLTEWALPTKKIMTTNEKDYTRERLILWLKQKNIKADLNPKLL